VPGEQLRENRVHEEEGEDELIRITIGDIEDTEIRFRCEERQDQHGDLGGEEVEEGDEEEVGCFLAVVFRFFGCFDGSSGSTCRGTGGLGGIRPHVTRHEGPDDRAAKGGDEGSQDDEGFRIEARDRQMIQAGEDDQQQGAGDLFDDLALADMIEGLQDHLVQAEAAGEVYGGDGNQEQRAVFAEGTKRYYGNEADERCPDEQGCEKYPAVGGPDHAADPRMFAGDDVLWQLGQEQIVPASHDQNGKDGYPVENVNIQPIGAGIGGSDQPPVGGKDQ